jgi:hypothetical protein
MRYIGNFKDYIPANLVSTLLAYPGIKHGPATGDNTTEVKIWNKAGYNLENIKWNSYTSEMIDVPVKLPEILGEIVEIWYTRLDPGDMFPLHQDVYSYGDENLIRYTMLLLDQMPGHIFCYNNKILTNYKAGDVYIFDNPRMWHAATNIGISPRLTMQISARSINLDTATT